MELTKVMEGRSLRWLSIRNDLVFVFGFVIGFLLTPLDILFYDFLKNCLSTFIFGPLSKEAGLGEGLIDSPMIGTSPGDRLMIIETSSVKGRQVLRGAF